LCDQLVNYTLQPIHFWKKKKEPRYPLQRRAAGPLSRFRHFGEDISFLALPAARSLGLYTVLTELSHLLSSEYNSYCAGMLVTYRIRRLEERTLSAIRCSLTIYPHLVPNLRMSGAIPLLPLYASMVWKRTTLPFVYVICSLLLMCLLCI
jgi:hypothetical protein